MKKLVIICALLTSGQFALAADAGCGLGSLIIQKNSKVLQLLAMTTNSFLFTQPLGITFGTSGCSASGIVSNDKEIQYYVEVNQQDLIKEMASAQGEKLNTLANLAGCKSQDSQKFFAEFTQKNISTICPQSDTSATDMVQNLRSAMQNSAEAISACKGS